MNDQLFANTLNRCCQIFVMLCKFFSRLTCFAKQSFQLTAIKRRHSRDIVVVAQFYFGGGSEISFIPTEQPIVLKADNFSNFFYIFGLAVGGQFHYLIFFAIMWKSKVLCKSSINQPRGYRKVNRIKYFDLISSSHRNHHSCKVTRSIIRKKG